MSCSKSFRQECLTLVTHPKQSKQTTQKVFISIHTFASRRVLFRKFRVVFSFCHSCTTSKYLKLLPKPHEKLVATLLAINGWRGSRDRSKATRALWHEDDGPESQISEVAKGTGRCKIFFCPIATSFSCFQMECVQTKIWADSEDS